MTGEIVIALIDEGFGFIKGDDDKLSRFFHCKDVNPRIAFDYFQVGQKVTFNPIDMGKQNPAMVKGNGLRAENVQPINDSWRAGIDSDTRPNQT